MTSTRRFGLIALAGLSLTGLAATAGTANSSATASIQCGVAKITQGGMMTVEGTILSATAITGDYRFSIRSQGSGGSSNISQASNFSAAADQVTNLGNVSINAGSKLDITFEVVVGGKTIDCSGDVPDKR